MKLNRLTLKMKLSMLFIGVLTVVIILITSLVSKNVLSIVTKNTEIFRLNSFSRIQNQMISLEADMGKLMQYILFDPQVESFCKTTSQMDAPGVVRRKAVGDFLDKILTVYPEIYSLFVHTSNGDVIGTEGIFNYNLSQEKFDEQNVSYNTVFWKSDKFSSNVHQNNTRQNVISLYSFFKYGNSIVKIVVNLKQESFYQMYEPFSESKLSNIYVCDYAGTVVSAGNASLFNNRLPFANNFNKTQPKGSFVYKLNNEDKQVIYMGLQNVDWLIVEEIPLKQYDKDINALKQNLWTILFISVICAVVLSIIFIRKTMLPFKLLIAAMNKMRQGSIGYRITDNYPNEMGEIVSCFNSMSFDIAALIENNKEIEAQKTKYAIAALKAQINPHFMFNTINMIKWMALAQKSTGIAQALEMLMALLKPIFKERLVNIQLKDELAYLQNYINLINLRFGGGISLDSELSPEFESLEIPQFILQPIIENCIEHGFNRNHANGKITIRCIQGKRPTVTISDNGQGMNTQTLETLNKQLLTNVETVENGDKIGIINVNMRLKLMRGSECGIAIQSQEGVGTTVIIKL